MTDAIVTVEDVVTSIVTGDDSLIVTETNETAVITSESNDVVVEVFDGRDGYSAYQIAVLNGFVGTEAAWLQSLVGESGRGAVAMFSPYSIAAAKAVLFDLTLADCSDVLTIGKVIGFTATSVNEGGIVDILYSGELSGFTELTAGKPVYLSATGEVSHNVPVSGYIQNFGVALSSTSVFISIKQPVQIAAPL